jgi:hypothetical protein
MLLVVDVKPESECQEIGYNDILVIMIHTLCNATIVITRVYRRNLSKAPTLIGAQSLFQNYLHRSVNRLIRLSTEIDIGL